jgi:Icc-related predicted phosphoesterase
MALCHFVSDLHGRPEAYRALFAAVGRERPAGLFLGGDLFPHELQKHESIPRGAGGFLDGFLAPGLRRLREDLGADYPTVFLILGNDDPRIHEAAVLAYAGEGLWTYAHERRVDFLGHTVCGYSCIPPSPFQLKDWERYDVSRFVDPGCIPPTDGRLSVPVSDRELRWRTIADDLERLAGAAPMDEAICLFHCPPYETRLDRAGLDGEMVDHAPLDVHIGSIAIRRFFQSRSPLVGLHGHVHESARLTGSWRDRIGRVELMTAAHDGPELALVRFDPDAPSGATRELIGTGDR